MIPSFGFILEDFLKILLVSLSWCPIFGDKFILVLGGPQVGSLRSSREYEKSGKTPLFSKLNYVCISLILIANGGGEFLLAYRVSCSGVMNFKDGFCGKLFTL